MKTKHLFDVYSDLFYEYGKPELRERTLQRLTDIANCGMNIVGLGQFGYEGVMSGLYIEKVWSYSDEDFKSYMDWAKELISDSKANFPPIIRKGFVQAMNGGELWVNTQTDEMVKFVVKDYEILRKFYCKHVKITIKIIDETELD